MKNSISSQYERNTDSLIDAHYKTGNDLVSCCICSEIYQENNIRWFIPHECGEYMPRDEGYVCSKACSSKWIDRHYEEIDEFLEIKG